MDRYEWETEDTAGERLRQCVLSDGSKWYRYPDDHRWRPTSGDPVTHALETLRLAEDNRALKERNDAQERIIAELEAELVNLGPQQHLLRMLLERLMTACGERGQSEGALDTLVRIMEERATLEAENARLRGGRPAEPLDSVEREIAAAEEREVLEPLRGRLHQHAAPGRECLSVSPSGRRCVLPARHHGMHSDGTVGWYLDAHHPVTPG